VAAEREEAGRFIGRADEILTAFVELERAIHEFAVDLINGPSATQSGLADWAHRGFMQITVLTGIHSMPVMRIV
jgi:hypothetical protein